MPGETGQEIINLVYAVEPGKRVYVERIAVRGNTFTQDQVIRREFDIHEGDAYNKSLAMRAERRLKALNLFKSVKTSTEPGSSPDRVVLDVDIQGARPASSTSPAAIRRATACSPK